MIKTLTVHVDLDRPDPVSGLTPRECLTRGLPVWMNVLDALLLPDPDPLSQWPPCFRDPPPPRPFVPPFRRPLG